MRLQDVVNELARVDRDQPASALIADSEPVVYDEMLARVDELDITRHPLGFVQVDFAPIVDLAPGTRARLHLWDNPDGPRDTLGTLHTHVWSLTSWVMRGRLSDATFTPTRTSSGEYFGSRVRSGDTYAFPDDGRYDLIPLEHREPRGGQVYTIPSGLVHESRVIEIPTATLMLSHDDPDEIQLGPLVLTHDRAGAEGTPERPRLSPDELESVLQGFR